MINKQLLTCVGLALCLATPVMAKSCNGSAPVNIKAGQKYNVVRANLIQNGWQPDINSPNKVANTGEAAELYKKGFREIVSCTQGMVVCRYRYTDKNSNILIVETQGETWEKNPYPSVSKFMCNKG